MKRTYSIFQLLDRQPVCAGFRRIAGGIGIALLAMTTGVAVGQEGMPAPDVQQPVAPNGYTLHESIDMGGHMSGVSGSGSMYDTMVNMQSGPRVLGESFELRALPGTQHMLVDSLSAFSNGWGGDPNNFARMDFYKGRLYDFSGTFRRDRQYFDYDLLGNPNVPGGLKVPETGSPTGSYVWPQIMQSPFLFNTVRRMLDTDLTLLPLSKVTFRAGYSNDIFQGPSLTPSGYQYAGSSSILLEEMQRNGTDRFYGAVDWKPIRNTKLTFEEQVDHYKADSFFTVAPSSFIFQEADGTKVAPLVAYYSTTAPTAASLCGGTTPFLSAPNTPGGLPVISPTCAVTTSYLRSQPTRFLYPTEIFRFQSSSIRNVAMNGDVRYTRANMNLPDYYENFQGLTKTTRQLIYNGNASARREVTAIDYGINWQATQTISLSDAFTYSSAQQPGTSMMTGLTTIATATSPGTINNPNLISTAAAAGAGTFEGSSDIGQAFPGFFGQRFLTNDVTATWSGWSRATVSLTYRHQNHLIGEGSGPGLSHSGTLIPCPGNTSGYCGTVTINQNGGILNIAWRPTDQWNVDGSVEMLYADNVFTPVAPREQQHYRLHALYRPKSWATLAGSYNDMELHNSTHNTQADIEAGTLYYGPLNHVAYSRIASVSADLTPNEHYGLDLSYAYSDVYTATNICYASGAAGAAYPGAATAPGTPLPKNVNPNGTCAGIFARGSKTQLVEWYGRDFEDAPTNAGSVAVMLSPSSRLHSNIGYRVNSVNGTRFYQDARDVAGSLVSTYHTPFVNAAFKLRPGFIWNAEYDYYGYGEGGPSGAPYCSTSTSATAAVVPCNSSTITGPTGLTEASSGLTAPRNFHSNMVTLGFHYEF